MKHWIFIGACDKRELLMYLGRILAANRKRVLLVDTSKELRYRYAMAMESDGLPIAEFCGMDVATGFADSLDLYRALDEGGESELAYDYILYDMDNGSFGHQDLWEGADEIVWVTGLGRYALEKGREQFVSLLELYPDLVGRRVKKVYMHSVDSQLTDEYISSFVSSLPICWEAKPVRIPLDEGNVAVRLEGEHAGTIEIRRITRAYKRVLIELVEELTKWDRGLTRKAVRYADRRRA
ncbi:hypothetical protein [Paenibacillus tuaregi]|uniref:hypothetical protein n=1 Tax=Paenibacillus tuaregi TaxID=1816681 RepID=UPI00083874B6|nr:hypothetical protein [Paenibacillus tuaregi]